MYRSFTYRSLAPATLAFLCLSGFAAAQSPAPPPPAPIASQLTPQTLGAMLNSAATFHDLVRSLNLSQSFGPNQDVVGPDGRLHHPLVRTAATIGAGAGAGAAIGEMTHSPNGVLIGALIGGVGGLIIDQVLKHKEEDRQRAFVSEPPPPANDLHDWHHFKERDHPAN
jgi:hypothetical protein